MGNLFTYSATANETKLSSSPSDDVSAECFRLIAGVSSSSYVDDVASNHHSCSLNKSDPTQEASCDIPRIDNNHDQDPVDLLRYMGFEYRVVSGDGDDIGTTNKSTTRLFHIKSNTMMTSKNRNQFISDGPIFDRVAAICQRIAQDKIQKDHSLKFITVGPVDGNNTGNQSPINALVDHDFGGDKNNNSHDTQGQAECTITPILVIVTGKGKSRAGILSMKELIHSGYEYGSATMHVAEAHRRGIKVVCLDPNACGKANGMNVVYQSLNYILFDCNSRYHNPVYYFLAHSAAGGYLVRYLLKLDDSCEEKKQQFLSKNLQAIAFSDSTHNVQWANKHHKILYDFLQSSKCLYIRNDQIRSSEFMSDHDNKYTPGEIVVDKDYFWHRRFGQIPTVWAGTTHHSLVCTVALKVIWKLFDEQLQADTAVL